jgi:hypothetical protein
MRLGRTDYAGQSQKAGRPPGGTRSWRRSPNSWRLHFWTPAIERAASTRGPDVVDGHNRVGRPAWRPGAGEMDRPRFMSPEPSATVLGPSLRRTAEGVFRPL